MISGNQSASVCHRHTLRHKSAEEEERRWGQGSGQAPIPSPGSDWCRDGTRGRIWVKLFDPQAVARREQIVA